MPRSTPMRRIYLLLLCLAFGTSLMACSDDSRVTTSNTKPPVLTVTAGFDQQVVFPTSTLRFVLKGTESLVITRAQLELAGVDQGGAAFSWSYEAQGTDELKQDGQGASLTRSDGDVGDLILTVPARAGLWQAINVSPTARFEGKISIALFDPFGQLTGRSTIEAARLDFQSDFTPKIEPIAQGGALYLGELVEVSGANILRPEEGTTWAQIQGGKMSYPNGTSRFIEDVRVPIRWAGRRDRGALLIDPSVLGVRQGSFTGALRFVNELSDGVEAQGNTQDEVSFTLEPSFISVPDPLAGSRGQRITIKGRGLVETKGDVRMTLIYDGRFIPSDSSLPEQDFSAQAALERSPDRYISDQGVESSVWYEIVSDGGRPSLTGLGAVPGSFKGSITPRFYDGFDNVEDGLPWIGEFRVLPTRQVIYLKYLPRFSQALDRFGLRNVERELRQAILDVAQRPYAEVNVEFTQSAPTDYIDYATIELSGPDPYGRKAFGYDNSFNDVAKDVDNLFLADYIGGWNRGSKEAFDNPFGGVYIESFDYFSAKLSGMRSDGSANDDVSESFDEIMAPFMPELGGTPVKATEWPDGPRAEQIQRAIHMFSNVVGNTVAHEVGHSMGLSFYPSDRDKPGSVFHNTVPGDGFLMDSGSDRPFEERANIKGYPAAFFNERNLTYLKEILPLP